MSNAFKEKWKWPKIDPKTGLYIDKYCIQYSYNICI